MTITHIPSLPMRTLGAAKSRLTVSALGFGAMGMTYHRGAVKDRNEMIRLLHKARDIGISLFDTAEVYGPQTNECLLGDAFAGDQDVFIATKFGFSYSKSTGQPAGLDSTPPNIRKVCEESLKRLKRERIDIFYQHRFDPQVPIEDVAGTAADLIAEGKIAGFGLCEVGKDIIRRAHAVCPITAVQSEYHLMWRKPEQNLFPTLEDLGIGFVPYSPINRGYLSGSMDGKTRFASKNDNRTQLPRFTAEAMQANRAFIDPILNFAKQHEATAPQICLAWLLAKRPWIVPIPGTTQEKHLTENIASLALNITESEWQQLEETTDKIPIVGDRYSGPDQKNVRS
jgi:aryl-alcohol dehydrogenase-like predicted oxidoreductase